MIPLPNPEHPITAQSPDVALAMVIFGEARGLTDNGRLAVGCAVRNRVNLDSAEFGYGWRSVISKPYAFSCLNVNDPNRARLFRPTQYERPEVWQGCYNAAQAILRGVEDLVAGAVFYYTRPLTDIPRKSDGSSVWGLVTPTVTVENVHFYRKA